MIEYFICCLFLLTSIVVPFLEKKQNGKEFEFSLSIIFLCICYGTTTVQIVGGAAMCRVGSMCTVPSRDFPLADLILLCLCLYVRDTYYGDRNGPVFEERDRTYNFYS